MVTAIFCFILSAVCLIISVFQFMEKGLCFNNAYLYASEEERGRMDKSPYYRQSAIVFLLIFIDFSVLGIYSIVYVEWLLILMEIITTGILIYAIISSIKIRKNNR